MLHCCDLWTLCFCFRDVMSLGISLVGHQKKIMSSIQTMRAQMLHLHGTGIQVWWRSKALPGRMNQNSPGNTVKCVTRQKIWKNKSTTKKKKNVPHPSGEINLPELAEQNHSFVIGKGFLCRCWKPRDGETMKKQTCERERESYMDAPLDALKNSSRHWVGAFERLFMLCTDFIVTKGWFAHSCYRFHWFLFSKSRVNIKISKSSS